MKRTRLDESTLVWIAACAMKCEPEAVLATVDVAALARVVSACEAAGDVVAEAAAVLTATIEHRPFPTANRASAFLAAACVLESARIRTRPISTEIAAIVECTVDAEQRLRDLVTAGTRAERYLPYPCPACGRRLRYRAEEFGPVSANFVGTSRYELTARCWYEHRVHSRAGTPLADVAPSEAIDDWAALRARLTRV